MKCCGLCRQHFLCKYYFALCCYIGCHAEIVRCIIYFCMIRQEYFQACLSISGCDIICVDNGIESNKAIIPLFGRNFIIVIRFLLLITIGESHRIFFDLGSAVCCKCSDIVYKVSNSAVVNRIRFNRCGCFKCCC